MKSQAHTLSLANNNKIRLYIIMSHIQVNLLLPLNLSVLIFFFFNSSITAFGGPGGSVVKKLPAKQKPWVLSLGQEDPLKEKMAAHSSILVCKIPWTEESGGL